MRVLAKLGSDDKRLYQTVAVVNGVISQPVVVLVTKLSKLASTAGNNHGLSVALFTSIHFVIQQHSEVSVEISEDFKGTATRVSIILWPSVTKENFTNGDGD